MKLIEGEELIWKGKPSWRSTMSFLTMWAAIAAVPLVVILVVNAVGDTDWPWWVGVAILLVAFGLAVLVGWVRRFFTQYTITTRRITIRRGVLAKTEQTAHIDRVTSRSSRVPSTGSSRSGRSTSTQRATTRKTS
jgi:uncharacterized membrane protein YdbT with pleckstrin-like domain